MALLAALRGERRKRLKNERARIARGWKPSDAEGGLKSFNETYVTTEILKVVRGQPTLSLLPETPVMVLKGGGHHPSAALSPLPSLQPPNLVNGRLPEGTSVFYTDGGCREGAAGWGFVQINKWTRGWSK